MDDWDADDWDAGAPVAPAKPAWPVRQAIPDAWDDEDASEEESPIIVAAAPKPSAPMKPSKALALALKAKEKEEQEREAARIRAREEELAAVSEAERKMRLQQIVEEADMDNTRSLFGEDTGFVPPEEDDKSIDKFKPKTPEELEKLAEMIGKKCRSLSTNPKRTENYVTFLKSLMRKLTLELDADDCKELSTHMGIIANERRDAFKRARGIKKKSTSKKANVRVGKASDDVRDARDDSYNDFDDYAFM